MSRKKSKEKSIENIVKDVIKNLSGKGRLTEETISEAWRSSAGNAAAKHTKPVSIKKSVLTVNVDSSGWLYELTIKRKDLIKSLNDKIKGKEIKGIRFRIGDIEKGKK